MLLVPQPPKNFDHLTNHLLDNRASTDENVLQSSVPLVEENVIMRGAEGAD